MFQYLDVNKWLDWLSSADSRNTSKYWSFVISDSCPSTEISILVIYLFSVNFLSVKKALLFFLQI